MNFAPEIAPSYPFIILKWKMHRLLRVRGRSGLHVALHAREFDACALELYACALHGVQEARREEK